MKDVEVAIVVSGVVSEPFQIVLFPVTVAIAKFQPNTAHGKLKAEIINQFGPKEKAKRRKFNLTKLGISDNDLWIASTAIQENLILVSRDEDFLRIKQVHNLSLENWII